MIELIEGLPRNVVAIAVKGRVTRQDRDDVLMPAMEKSLKRHDMFRLYYELSARFPGAAWDDLDLGIEHPSRCERVAIVTDVGWVRLTIKALRFLIPGEVRVFDTIEAPAGRAWIVARSGSRIDANPAAALRARARRRSPAPALTAANRRAAAAARRMTQTAGDFDGSHPATGSAA